jgi:2-dehydropantoate 2-reductase
MSSIESVAVIGAGAMGAFYASKLFDWNKDCVTLIAKAERYNQLKEKGLIVNKKNYVIPVVRPSDKTVPSDFIIVAVKHHHLPQAIKDIKNVVGEDSIIISVMNGITSEEQIAAVYGINKVLYAVALGIDAVRQGNNVTYTTQGKLFFGEAKNPVLTKRVKRVQSLLDRAGIANETPEDMIRILWWKFMINVGINQVSAVLRTPYEVFQTSQDARLIMEEAMREVVTIAKAAHVHLSEEDIKNWYSILSTLSPQGKTSMLQDVEATRKTEVEMFAGKMTELGKTYGIPTPVNQTLLRMIKVIEQRYKN